MTWLQFWASVIGSLAWPLTVMVVFLTFRRQLLKLAPWLRELEVGNLKVKFAEELAKAATAAEGIQPNATGAPTPATPSERDLILAEHAPLGLVLQSWLMIEHALADEANKLGLMSGSVVPRATNVRRITEELEQTRRITPATARTLHYLRDLRNRAVHHKGFTVDADQALEYSRLTKRVLYALDDTPTPIPGMPS